MFWSSACLETNKTTKTIKTTWSIERIEPMGGKSPPQGVVRHGAVEGIYLWLTTATPAIYKYRRDYILIEPSDALGSTPLTIRNIAMGNLLSMTKSVSRWRIRRDAGHRRRRRRCRRTNSLAGHGVMNGSYLLHIWRSCACRRLTSVANLAIPTSRKPALPMNDCHDFHNRSPPLYRYVSYSTIIYERIDSERFLW